MKNTIITKAASLLDEGAMSDSQRKAMFAKRGKAPSRIKSSSISLGGGNSVSSVGRVLAVRSTPASFSKADKTPLFKKLWKTDLKDLTTRHSALRKAIAGNVKAARKYPSVSGGNKSWITAMTPFKHVSTSITKADKKGKRKIQATVQY